MLAFNAFFDTSDTDGDRNMLITAGVIADVNRLVGFEENWKAVLSEFGVVRFHPRDFASFKREFATWVDEPERRAALVARLVEAAKEHTNHVIVQGLALTDYRSIDDAYQLTEAIGEPY